MRVRNIKAISTKITKYGEKQKKNGQSGALPFPAAPTHIKLVPPALTPAKPTQQKIKTKLKQRKVPTKDCFDKTQEVIKGFPLYLFPFCLTFISFEESLLLFTDQKNSFLLKLAAGLTG